MALKVMLLNKRLYDRSWRVYQSVGDIYQRLGNEELAREYFLDAQLYNRENNAFQEILLKSKLENDNR